MALRRLLLVFSLLLGGMCADTCYASLVTFSSESSLELLVESESQLPNQEEHDCENHDAINSVLNFMTLLTDFSQVAAIEGDFVISGSSNIHPLRVFCMNLKYQPPVWSHLKVPINGPFI